MQRVRIGLTGLAFVFLAVLLAAIFTSQPAGEAPITAESDRAAESGSAGRDAAGPAGRRASRPSRSPQLGVTPGNADRTATRRPRPRPDRAESAAIHRLIHRTNKEQNDVGLSALFLP